MIMRSKTDVVDTIIIIGNMSGVKKLSLVSNNIGHVHGMKQSFSIYFSPGVTFFHISSSVGGNTGGRGGGGKIKEGGGNESHSHSMFQLID